MTTPRPGAESVQRSRVVPLPPDALHFVRRTIADRLGDSEAEEVLFRSGRDWGLQDARRFEPSQAGEPPVDRAGLLAGCLELALEHGLARIVLDDARTLLSEDSCRVVGRLLDETADQPLCRLTLGYLTGVVSIVTGMDVVCSPVRCLETCESRGSGDDCGFEILPAQQSQRTNGSRPPLGSGRFKLESMASSFGTADVSLDHLIEKTTDAIIFCDRRGVIQFWNAGAERMFQYTREESLGLTMDRLVPDELLASDELGRLQSCMEADGSISNFMTRRVRKDGVTLHVSLTGTVLRDDRGMVLGESSVIRDLTAQRLVQAELQKTRELAVVGEMASMVAHEVKNPLAGIYAGIQLLSRGEREGSKRMEMFQEVVRSIRRLDDTIGDLLTFARPAPLKLVRVDLRCLVEETIASLTHIELMSGIDVSIEVEDGTDVWLDTRRMGQVITNLVMNAAQAMPGGGRLSVHAEVDIERVVLGFKDEGAGIAPELLETIFDPFFTTKSRGTGLGLAIARKNVESHSGTIHAGNDARGAWFRLTLPRSEVGVDACRSRLDSSRPDE